MKRIVFSLLVTILFSTCLLAAEENPFNNYRQNPGKDTFETAYKALSENVGNDESDNRSRLFLTYLLLMETDRTMQYFADNLDSLDMQMRFGYANLLFELGKYEEAIPIYEGLNSASPDWSCPWRHKGTSLYHTGEFEKSETSLKKAIETNESHYDAYIWLAKAQLKLGKYTEALATFDKGISVKDQANENPEEEIPAADEAFLHLTLLKKNGKTQQYDELKAKLQKAYPDDSHWKDLEG